MKENLDNIRIIDRTEGVNLGVAGSNYRVIISAENTLKSYSAFEMLIPPGAGPAPHSHPDIQEFFYIIEGELTFKTINGHSKVSTGGFVHIPYGGAVHCFINDSEQMARVLCTVMPAGMEEIFTILGVPVKGGEFVPQVDITSELKESIALLNEKFNQTIFPPNYLDK